MKAFLRLFFKLLYHQFAFTYDFVAAAVSFNRWKDWTREILPLIEGTRILELGHGPGHLHRLLRRDGWFAVGIDESPQMSRLARRNTNGEANLTRGLAQHLPFADESFDTIVSTFPTEYIFDPRALAEARRCLMDRGRLIVLPVAMPKNRLLEWLYKFTGESPSESEEVIKKKLKEPFARANFETEIMVRDVKSSRLLIIIATKLCEG
ncbi:MAG TPA: methyltransferase domain-containing protein [Anaerolineales bacterium]|nr:methyltransferase domain-containing protein [Anaerolineales bacterium]HQX17068.1 methyltransferase domain-containing protein [Anaerolineales bacterium]